MPAGGELAVIAEVKRRSPSKGPLDAGLDPAAVAADYEAGGAACVSVLTDEEFFGGSPADLAAARSACGLPVLRKDFTVSRADVCDARLMGADAVLLIVAALSDDELSSFLGLAQELSLDALVEVHDEAELERALDAGAELVGVNQRDLTTFAVDPERAARLVGGDPGRGGGRGRVRDRGTPTTWRAWPMPGTRRCWWGSRSSAPPDRRAAVRRSPGTGSALASRRAHRAGATER